MALTRKEESLKKKIVRILKESGESTTTHAIPSIIRNEYSFFKGFWLVFLLLSTATCAYFIYGSITNFMNFEVTNKFNVIYETPTVFPTVTICNINPFTTNESYVFLKSMYPPELNLTNLYPDYGKLDTLQNSYLFYRYYSSVLAKNPAVNDSTRQSFAQKFDNFVLSCFHNNIQCGENEFKW